MTAQEAADGLRAAAVGVDNTWRFTLLPTPLFDRVYLYLWVYATPFERDAYENSSPYVQRTFLLILAELIEV